MKTQEFFDRLTTSNKADEKMPRFWGNALVCALRPLAQILWRVDNKDVKKIRSLKDKTGFVLVSNHTSFLDVFCFYVFIRFKQWPRFIARDTLFDHKLLGFFLSRAGAFPIKRDAADRKAIKRAAKMLKNKEIVGIMPEGTRRSKGSKKPVLHAGAAFIARMGGNVPIIPVAAVNIDKVKEKGKVLRFPKVTIAYGDPILLEDFDFLPKDEKLEACIWYAMRETFALFKQTSTDKIDMKELFPSNKDYTDVFKKNKIPKHSISEIVKRYDE